MIRKRIKFVMIPRSGMFFACHCQLYWYNSKLYFSVLHFSVIGFFSSRLFTERFHRDLPQRNIDPKRMFQISVSETARHGTRNSPASRKEP